MADASRDQNFVPTLLGVSNADGVTPVKVYANPTTHRLLTDNAGGGSGTVTDVSVVTANGFAGTVATSTTTPAITLTTTITGVLKGNGTAISAASASTDYAALAFKTIAVATQSDVVADSPIDTLTLVAGTGMTITTNAGTDTITFAASGGAATSVTIGTTTITSGTDTRILYDNAGVLGEYTLTGTGTAVVMANTPTLITPVIGVATGTSLDVSGVLESGTNSGTGGQLKMFGSTSGDVTLKVAAAAGTATVFQLPADNGTNTFLLQTNGSGVTSWVTTPAATAITVANEASDSTCFPVFVTAATGNLGPKSNAGFLYDANTSSLAITSTSASFVGSSNAVAAVLTNTFDNASVRVADFGGHRATVAANDEAYINMYLSDDSTTNETVARLTWVATDVVAGTVDGRLDFSIMANDTLAKRMQLTPTGLNPSTDGGLSLGTTALGWQNFFANTGFVLNIENSDWVATHTSGILTVGTGDLRVTNAGANTASVVTVGGTQTLTNKTLTAPTLGGATSLADGATIKLIVPTVDGTATGPTTAAFVSGYSSSAIGDLVILDSSGKWQKTDANTSSIYNGMLGIALAVAATDAALLVALPGSFVYATAFPTMTIGAAMYMSETAGAITATAPTTTDAATRLIGYAVHADKIFFNPSNDWITHT